MNIENDHAAPLQGVRVLDFADERADFCTKLLAEMGARVIKVERPGGDPSRRRGPFWKDMVHPERSLSFWYANTNKLGITLSIECEAGREILKRLIERTDVLVETFPPGYLSTLGLDYRMLSKINPMLVLTSVTGFGQSGPRRDYPSCDLSIAAYGGQLYVTGQPDLPPLKVYGPQSYYTASLFAAFGIVLSLRRRRQCGKGEHLDISLQEAVASSLDHVLVRFLYEKDIAKRQGSMHWNHTFCIFPCKDGFIHLTLFQQWDTLVEWMNNDGMAADLSDKKFKDEDYRRQHVAHIIDVMRNWTRRHAVGELFELGQLMGFPWAPVCRPDEVVKSPQHGAREFFTDIEHPELGVVLKYPGPPYRFSKWSPNPQKRAPLIGEDNLRIYQGELGLTAEELTQLSSINAI